MLARKTEVGSSISSPLRSSESQEVSRAPAISDPVNTAGIAIAVLTAASVEPEVKAGSNIISVIRKEKSCDSRPKEPPAGSEPFS